MEKLKPPFPRLPSFVVSATVLSYMRYRDNYQDLLHRLSWNTRKYAKSHQQQLQAFITGVYRELEFQKFDLQYCDADEELEGMPTDIQLQQYSRSRLRDLSVSLKKIELRATNSLQQQMVTFIFHDGRKFKFKAKKQKKIKNGIFYHTSQNFELVKTILVNSKTQIKKIGCNENQQFCIIDQNDEFIAQPNMMYESGENESVYLSVIKDGFQIIDFIFDYGLEEKDDWYRSEFIYIICAKYKN